MPKSSTTEKPQFGAFIAVGRMGMRVMSKNGKQWTKPIIEDRPYTLGCIAAGNGKAVIGGLHGGGENVYFQSENLEKWDMVKQKSDYVYMTRDVAFGNNEFLTILSGGVNKDDGGTMQSSSDGLKWSERFKRKKRSLNKAMWLGDKWFGIGNYGLKSISTDGREWTDAENQPASDTLISMAASNDRIVGVGLHGMRMVSPDGLQWSKPQHGEEGEHLHSVMYTGEEFVAVGLGATYTSKDGLKWKRTATEDAPVFCAFGNGLFVGSAYKGRMMISDDGIKWKEVFKAPEHIQAVAFI